MTKSVAAAFARALENSWPQLAGPNQLPPKGDWSIWLLLAGRGFGKTRTLSEWVWQQVRSGRAQRIALVGATAADVRDVMVEGQSGIMNVCLDYPRPLYEPTKRRVTWPNQAIATLYSADEPERLRGPQHDAAVADELGSWRHPEAWDMLMFGLRLGNTPRAVVATTPRPTKLIRGLLAREGKDVVITRGSTYENRANLAPLFMNQIVARYEGTRLGRQELEAEVLTDTPGALWTHNMLEESRVDHAPAELKRIVVAIDPAAKSGEDSDETGIIVAGTDAAGHGYVLDDLSGRYAPAEWARQAIRAYRQRGADRIVAEVNAGGEMVEQTLRTIDGAVSFHAVHASRGKVTRAEPIAALFEQRKVHLVGCFPELEDQLCAFTSDFNRAQAGFSPDRLDAMVWALTDLMVERMNGEWLYELYRQEHEALRARQAVAV
jgi:predicted phage terminase large subunit-like protein